MSTFLVTGANGFVGTALCHRLLEVHHDVLAVVREGRENAVRSEEGAHMPRRRVVEATTDFEGLPSRWPASTHCDTAIHLASRVHVMNASVDAPEAYARTNVAGSLRVAETAARAGAKRFVFVSSIKAMGDTEPGTPPRPWSESDAPHPSDPYGRSKLDAEHALETFCKAEGLEWVIVRPPLVYGPGVRANFLQLMAIVARRVPLPLGRVTARRSMIFVENLVDAIVAGATHPAAANHCFNVSDGVDFAVADIVRILGDAMDRPARLLSMPPSLLEWMARAAGRTEQASRLLSPLRVDTTLIQKTLDWHPPVAAETGLRRTAIWYRDAFLTNRH